MRKFLALCIGILLVFSLSTIAFASDVDVDFDGGGTLRVDGVGPRNTETHFYGNGSDYSVDGGISTNQWNFDTSHFDANTNSGSATFEFNGTWRTSTGDVDNYAYASGNDGAEMHVSQAGAHTVSEFRKSHWTKPAVVKAEGSGYFVEYEISGFSGQRIGGFMTRSGTGTGTGSIDINTRGKGSGNGWSANSIQVPTHTWNDTQEWKFEGTGGGYFEASAHGDSYVKLNEDELVDGGTLGKWASFNGSYSTDVDARVEE